MSETWELPEDARKNGMKYPNYNMVKSPGGSGHIIDDSEGAESITWFHRSGSSIQIQPDGSLVIKTQKNAYHVTLGDNNVLITGAHNVTINGGGALKVEGDYDVTVKGNMKQTIEGNIETVCNGDMTTTVKGNSETVIGDNQSTKVAGKSEYVAVESAFASQSKTVLKSGGTTDIASEGVTNITASSVEFAQG